MPRMRLRYRVLLLTLGILLPLLLARAEGTAVFTPLAQSAQVLVESTRSAQGLTLRFVRTTGGMPLPVSELTVSLAGRNLPATRQSDGSWFLPGAGAATTGRLELIVGHDGIRELLSGSAPGAAAPPAAATHTSEHKQLWWWVLNIAIVLVAVLAISRRMS
jgi:hypothetical protein